MSLTNDKLERLRVDLESAYRQFLQGEISRGALTGKVKEAFLHIPPYSLMEDSEVIQRTYRLAATNAHYDYWYPIKLKVALIVLVILFICAVMA